MTTLPSDIEDIHVVRNGQENHDIHDENSWIAVERIPTSIYSTAIFYALLFHKSSVTKQLLIYTLMLGFSAIVALIQGVLLVRLYTSFLTLSELPLCLNWDPLLYFSAVMVFFASLIPSLYDLIQDAALVFCPGKIWNDVDLEKDLTNNYRRFTLPFFIALMILLYEVIVWIFVAIVGIYYLFSQSGVSNIVQALVAISFINELDNIMYWLLFSSSKSGRGNMKAIYAKNKIMDISSELEPLQILTGLPISVVIVCCIVFGIHSTYC
eukprot:gene15833-21449_t